MMIKKLTGRAGHAQRCLQGSACAAETIKLGVVNIDSGPLRSAAPSSTTAPTFAVEQLNAQGGALGRKYELVIAEPRRQAGLGDRGGSRLVEQQKVSSFFTGLNPSGTSLAIESKMPR